MLGVGLSIHAIALRRSIISGGFDAYTFLVDGAGNYLVDGSGNYLIITVAA